MEIVTLIALALVAALGVALVRTTYGARKSAAPYFPTPKAAVYKALQTAALKPGETFYDLGAGTGRALLIAEKEFGARAVGFELSFLFYFIAKINLFLHRSGATMILKDFWNADLRDADVVFCFLAIRTMQKTEDKLRRELKPGARIVVYAFPLPGMVPQQTFAVHGQWKMFLYENK